MNIEGIVKIILCIATSSMQESKTNLATSEKQNIWMNILFIIE